MVLTPIALLLLFVYVFGGALGEQTGSIDYVDFITPGVVVMTVGSGIAYTAVRLSMDLQKGIIGRFRTMPVAPSSVLSGQALSSTLSNLFSSFLVLVVAFIVGFRPNGGTSAWLWFVGLLVLFTLATTWMAMFFGLLARTVEGCDRSSGPPVLTAVDHAILRVPELGTAVDTYRRLGFTVTHPPQGSDGAAAYAVFGDFHLEFREARDRRRPGLETMVLRSNDLETDLLRLRNGGIPVTAPVDDPVAVGGRTLARRSATADSVVPVKLIEHHLEGGELLDLLGALPAHPNTATVMERIYVAVESIHRDLAPFEQVLGQAAPEPELGTVIMSLMSVFYLGDNGIAVAEPRGPGPTADALRARGPGMFQVLLRAEHLDQADDLMVRNGMPAPARGTRLSGESALLVEPENACGVFVAMAGKP